VVPTVGSWKDRQEYVKVAMKWIKDAKIKKK
jgi:hypothetical protein